ncbi:unnamed protein product [Mucor hiemalis]
MKNLHLVSKSQVANFLNIVFLPTDPFNEEVYECKQVEVEEILSFVQKHSPLFAKATVSSLGKWLKSAKVILTESTMKRIIRNTGEKVQARNLYVMKDEYLEDTLKNVVSYFEEYQQHIKSLKKEGYNIIGYARKSKGKETEETRVKLLKLMCDCLKNRSLVDRVFVSYSCNASDPLSSRAKNQKVVLKDGNTQGKNRYLAVKTEMMV